jgi:hypothetical protein
MRNTSTCEHLECVVVYNDKACPLCSALDEIKTLTAENADLQNKLANAKNE